MLAAGLALGSKLTQVFRKPPLCVDCMFGARSGHVCVHVDRKWLARVVKVRPVYVCVCPCGLCVDRVLIVSRWYLGDE